MAPPRRGAWLLAALLAGAGAEPARRVALLRHCPRAPYASDRHPPLPPYNFTSINSYSSSAFPSYDVWGAAQGKCTPNGLALARRVGTALQGLLWAPHARVVADVGRCAATAAALGLNTSAVKVDQPLFDPLSAELPNCSQPDWQGTVEAEVARLRERLRSARGQLPKLQAVLGAGQAPPLERIPDNVSDGYFVGGLRAASEAVVETFELERTSSMPVAWGKLTDGGLQEFLKLRATYFEAMYGGRDIAQRYASGILSELLAPATPGATVLVGHDTNVQGVASLLGLEWQCGPWAAGAIPPLSGFLFTLAHGRVTVQSVCPTLADGPALAAGDATFAGGKGELPLEDFSALANRSVEWRCVNASGARPEAPRPLFV